MYHLILGICLVVMAWVPVFAGPKIVTGYKSSFYIVTSEKPEYVCEYNNRYVEQWCVDVGTTPMGIYVGFRQILAYSRDKIHLINPVKQSIEWSLSLKNVHKIHINYPVIITLKSGVLTGYDFFTGYELWSKNVGKQATFFDVGVDVWLTQKDYLKKLDIVSSDFREKVPFKEKVQAMNGDDIHLFIESNGVLKYMNAISLETTLIGKGMRVIEQVSDMILLGSKHNQQLVSLSNELISKNVVEKLIKIHSPTKTQLAYIRDSLIYIIDSESSKQYQFTGDYNHDTIDYAYKLDNQLWVFSNNKKSIWTLKPSTSSDPGI